MLTFEQVVEVWKGHYPFSVIPTELILIHFYPRVEHFNIFLLTVRFPQKTDQTLAGRADGEWVTVIRSMELLHIDK